MRMHIFTVAILAFAAAAIAVPRNKRQAYDEPRLSNEVIPGTIDDIEETSGDAVTRSAETEDTTTIITTKVPALDDVPTPRPGNKKKKPTSPAPPSDTFSRVIDDIFNIPISVLRAVNTLLSNAFGRKQTAVESPASTSSSSSTSTA